MDAQIIGKQLLRSATQYWLELLQDAEIGNLDDPCKLVLEAREIAAILVAVTRSTKTAELIQANFCLLTFDLLRNAA